MTRVYCYYIFFLRIFPVVLNESRRLQMLAIGSPLKKEILLSCFIFITWIKFLNVMCMGQVILTCSILYFKKELLCVLVLYVSFRIFFCN